MNSKDISTSEKFFLVFGSTSVCFFSSLVFLSTLFFVVKIPVSKFNILISTIFTFGFSLWFSKKISLDYFLGFIAFCVFAFSFLIALFVSTMVYDLSFDGQAYHQEAVIQLWRGWNPVYMILTDEATANLERWLNHYPKAVWIVGASIYKMTGKIEAGKVMSIYSGVIAFVFCYLGLVRFEIRKGLNILASLLLTLNPVFLYQTLSFYVDGVLVSYLLVLVFLSLRFIKTREKYLFWPFFLTLVFLINIKLTAVVYVGALTGMFFLYLWFNDKTKLSINYLKFTFVSVLTAVLFLGFNPFVTNFSLKGHPLYPAMGRGALDYVPGNTPENYWHVSAPVRLFMSMFSTSTLERGEGSYVRLKIPFVFSFKELETFRETNAKTGGFGPLFSGAFVVSFFALVYLLFSQSGIREKFIYLAVFVFPLVTASAVSLSSVARFVPFVWWAPCFVVLLLLVKRTWVSSFFAVFIFLVLVINNIMIAYVYYPYNLAQSRDLDGKLKSLSQNLESPIYIDVLQFGSTKIKLNSYSIAYHEVLDESACKEGKMFLTRNISKLCEPVAFRKFP